MEAWEILKHLQEGGIIGWGGFKYYMGDGQIYTDAGNLSENTLNHFLLSASIGEITLY